METPKEFDEQDLTDFDKQLIASPFLNQFANEFAQANAEAIALVFLSAAQQIDIARLASDLRASLEHPASKQAFQPMARKIAAQVYRLLDQQRIQKAMAANRPKGTH